MMRALLLVIAVLAGMSQAAAQGDARAYAGAKAAFEAMPPQDQIALQLRLLLIGRQSVPVSDTFSHEIFDAIRAVQEGAKQKADGVLTANQKEALSAAAHYMAKQLDLVAATSREGLPVWQMGGLSPHKHADLEAWIGNDLVMMRGIVRGSDMAGTEKMVRKKIGGGTKVQQWIRKGEHLEVFTLSDEGHRMVQTFIAAGDRTGLIITNWEKAKEDAGWLLINRVMASTFNLSMRGIAIPPGVLADASSADTTPATTSLAGSGESRHATGILVSRDGHVLTSARHVHGCKEVEVTDRLGGKAQAQIVAMDPTNDLALLRTALKRTPQAVWRTSAKRGEAIAAFGFNETGFSIDQNHLTDGTVSALTGPKTDSRFMLLSTRVEPSMSGGPVIDADGYVVGMLASHARVDEMTDGEFGAETAKVNFALKGIIAMSFLEGNRIALPSADETPASGSARIKAMRISTAVSCLEKK